MKHNLSAPILGHLKEADFYISLTVKWVQRPSFLPLRAWQCETPGPNRFNLVPCLHTSFCCVFALKVFALKPLYMKKRWVQGEQGSTCLVYHCACLQYKGQLLHRLRAWSVNVPLKGENPLCVLTVLFCTNLETILIFILVWGRVLRYPGKQLNNFRTFKSSFHDKIVFWINF